MKRRWAVVLVILGILVGSAAGTFRARTAVPAPSQGFTRPEECPTLKAAEVEEKLHVRTTWPLSYDRTVTIELPADDSLVQELVQRPGSEAAHRARFCLFAMPFVFGYSPGRETVSIDRGRATVSTSIPDQSYIFADSPWQRRLSGQSMTYTFDRTVLLPQVSADETSRPDWSAAEVVVTLVLDSRPITVASSPQHLKDLEYRWHIDACAEPPTVAATVAVSPLNSWLAKNLSRPVRAGGTSIIQVIGWSTPILIVLAGLVLAVLVHRCDKSAPSPLGMVIVATIGLIPAVATFDLEQPNELAVISLLVVLGVSVALLFGLRAGWPALVLAALPALAWTFGPRIRVVEWFSAAVAVILVAAVARGFAARLAVHPAVPPVGTSSATPDPATAHIARHQDDATAEPKATEATQDASVGGQAVVAPPAGTVAKTKGRIRPWASLAAMALAASLAYSLSNVGGPWQLAASTALSTLRYPLAAFAVLLVAVALTLPLIRVGPAAGGAVVAAGCFGWAVLAKQPVLDVLDVSIPLGAALFALALYLLVRPAGVGAGVRNEDDDLSKLRSSQPHSDTLANALLALRISGVLAIVPVAFVVYTTLTNLPERLERPGVQAVFVLASIALELTRWLVTGCVFAALSTRWLGFNGPLRGLAVSAAWFAAALVTHLLDDWGQPSGSTAWSFPGFELVLFLIAFAVVWDAWILHEDDQANREWRDILQRLREAYNVTRARAVVGYATPVLLAVVALGQQVANGTAEDVVTNTLHALGALLA
jgi:hypothetical protein